MKRILFQGDSITDSLRQRTEDDYGKNLGMGYPSYVAAQLGNEFVGEYEFFNLGIGGNRLPDLYVREKTDIINMKPDYMSIMIGVNDVWHKAWENGVENHRFEGIYQWLIEDVKAALPDIKIMIIAPYCGSLCEDKFEGFCDEVKEKAAIAKKIAEKNGLAFMDSQAIVDEAIKKAPIEYWTEDGVHPTVFLSKLIADEWIKVFKEQMR